MIVTNSKTYAISCARGADSECSRPAFKPSAQRAADAGSGSSDLCGTEPVITPREYLYAAVCYPIVVVKKAEPAMLLDKRWFWSDC